MPGVQKNTSFPLWSKIRKPSGFCGIFKVSKRNLALTFALCRTLSGPFGAALVAGGYRVAQLRLQRAVVRRGAMRRPGDDIK
jgi:hypothetical protein